MLGMREIMQRFGDTIENALSILATSGVLCVGREHRYDFRRKKIVPDECSYVFSKGRFILQKIVVLLNEWLHASLNCTHLLHDFG